jgi:CheY-like chemotaxis protein
MMLVRGCQGVDVLFDLKQSERLCGLPPVVAMTGNTSQQDKDRYKQVGFLDTLGKPFSLDNLRILLRDKVANLDVAPS